jgi:hypothetical protein
MPPTIVSFVTVELDGNNLVIQRGDGNHVETVLSMFIIDEKETEDVRTWLMLIQYPDEIEPLVATLSQKYGRR